MTWAWSMGVDRATGPDWSVLQYPRIARGNRAARKLVADALREFRRQRRVSRGRLLVVVRS